MPLDSRLHQYSASLKSLRYLPGWKMYAAVTGSALAMATNAAADIIYSGVKDIQVSIAGATVSNSPSLTSNVELRSQASFKLGIQQDLNRGFVRGAAYLNGGSGFGFLNTSDLHVKKLSSGFRISGGDAPFVPGYNLLANQTINTANHQGLHSGWTAAKAGFAGFSFKTANMSQPDYGWLRLVYSVGTNGAANKFEVIDWGYNNTGGPISAGQEPSAPVTTPEPGTAALGLLALGSAGILELRRRRKSIA